MDEKYQRLQRIVEHEMQGADPAHDIHHVMRVYRLCVHLAKDQTQVNMDVLIPAALLHDIARKQEDHDPSGSIDHAVLGAQQAEEMLRQLEFSDEAITAITHCIRTHRFRSDTQPMTLEAQLLSDADKLDVLGAVGVARSFMIAGQYREQIYSTTPLNEYIHSNLVDGKPQGRIKDVTKHAPNLEYETKLQYIPEKLYTRKAKTIAQQRREYMKQFFHHLRREIYDER
jgi:uncharacterized protein